MDLRQEFNELLDEFGHYVLLHRTGRKIRCRCWNEKYQEADSNCLICGGTGWVSRIERHKIRRQRAVQVISQPNLNQQTTLGKMWIDAQSFYMHHNVYPKVGDYIYEVGWSGYRPTHLINAYRINDVDGHRGDNGRIEFWSSAGKAETINHSFKNILVRSIGPIKNYEIIT